jgi:23S rRNA pseudouridine1911/1915/1917 synthase
MYLSILEGRILFEDNHLLVLNKKAGWLSQGDKTGDPSLIDYVKSYIKHKYDKPGNVFLGLPHRLDRPVSGAIITCKTSKALTRVNKMLQKGSLDKRYHALVLNAPPESSGRIVSFLKKDHSKNRVSNHKKEVPGSKKAVLDYEYIQRVSDRVHLLELRLYTGRPHQIRVQLASIGCPIIGDIKYARQNALPDKSIALHSREILLTHPVSKEELRLTAPYPEKKWWYL